jgi:hypothetical protein
MEEKEAPMNAGVYVRLRPDELDRVAQIAKDERRPLRDQAAVLIAEALARRTPKTKEAMLT